MLRSDSQDSFYSDEEELTKEEKQILEIQQFQNLVPGSFLDSNVYSANDIEYRPPSYDLEYRFPLSVIKARDEFIESKDLKENFTKMLRIFTNELIHDFYEEDDVRFREDDERLSKFQCKYSLINYIVKLPSAYILWAPAILSYLSLPPQRNAETAIQASIPYFFSPSLIRIITEYLGNNPDLFNLNLLTSETNEVYVAQCRPIADRLRKKTSTLDDCIYIKNVCLRIASFIDPLSSIHILQNLQYGLARRGEDFRNKKLIETILINIQSLFILAERLFEANGYFKPLKKVIHTIKLNLMGAIIELEELDMRSVDVTLPMSVYFTPYLAISDGLRIGGVVNARGDSFWISSDFHHEFYGIWSCKRDLVHEILFLNLLCEKSKYQQQRQLGVLHPEEFVLKHCRAEILNSKHPYALRDGFRRVSQLDSQSPEFWDNARAIFLEMNITLTRIEKNKVIKPKSDYFGCKNRSGHVFFGCGLFENEGRLQRTLMYLSKEHDLQDEQIRKASEFHSQAKKKIGNPYFGCKNPSGAKPEAKAADFLVQQQKPYIPYVRRRGSFS
ncbi:MAG: hypothetical protein ACYCQI_08450 [Gammaproteobacteria bacterium]